MKGRREVHYILHIFISTICKTSFLRKHPEYRSTSKDETRFMKKKMPIHKLHICILISKILFLGETWKSYVPSLNYLDRRHLAVDQNDAQF